MARRFTRDCHELGITIHGTFVLGLPGETRETIEETIRFAREINPPTIQVSLAAPYPGTELYRQAVENGWLDRGNAELVDDHGVQIAPLHYPGLSRDAAQPGDDDAAPARGRRVLPVHAPTGDAAVDLVIGGHASPAPR